MRKRKRRKGETQLVRTRDHKSHWVRIGCAAVSMFGFTNLFIRNYRSFKAGFLAMNFRSYGLESESLKGKDSLI